MSVTTAPKMFMHTKKAVRSGCPEHRVFLVTATWVERGKTRYGGWKCEISPVGLIHPALDLGTPLNKVLKTLKAQNGSEPTADFFKDSFYCEVTKEDVIRLLAEAKANPEKFSSHPRYRASCKDIPVDEFIKSLTQEQLGFVSHIISNIKYHSIIGARIQELEGSSTKSRRSK
jgi:hypothetical protein